MQGPLEEDFNRSPQDLLTRTCTSFKSFSQGPVQDHAKAPDSISLGSPQALLTRNCKRPWPRSSCQDLLLLERILQDLETRTSQEHPRRAFIQAPLIHGVCKIFMQGPLWEDLIRFATGLLTRMCTRWCKNVLERTSQGEDVSRIFTRSSQKDLCKIMQRPLRGFHQGLHKNSHKHLYKTLSRPSYMMHHETLARAS